MSRNWEQIRRNPVPSLLKALLEDHLDPGYAAAAHDRAAGHARPTRVGIGLWLVLGGLLAGLVLGVAYAQNIERESGTDQARNEILATVRTAEDRNDVLAATRDDVATQVEQRRIEVLADDEQGAAVLDRLARAEEAAAAAPVRGPGITVTLADPTSRPDLTDSAEKDRARSTSVILDRDLQSVVNALWAGGAEAVAINGVRVGPGVTVRQAGERCSWTTSRSSRPTRSPPSGHRPNCRPASSSATPTCVCRGATAVRGRFHHHGGDGPRVAGRLGTRRRIGTGNGRAVKTVATKRGYALYAVLALGVGIAVGVIFSPQVPDVVQPYLPIAVVAALDAVFGGLRAYLDEIFDAKVFVVSFTFNVLVAALIVWLGDQLGVGTQLSTAVVVVLGIRIFGNASALRRRLFGA